MSDASAIPVPRRKLAVLGGVLGVPVRGFFGYFGDHSLMLWQAALWLFRRPFRLRLFLDQMEFIGVQSLPIILLVGFFSGAVSAQQAVRALKLFGQERFVGATVGLSLALELAPVFTALMIAARAGSGMATELGSMRITEQIDALSTFAVNPIQYLITPRIVAGVIMLPVMTMVFNAVGLIGAYVYAVPIAGVDVGSFIEHFRYLTDPSDYLQGAIKAAIFGGSLSLAACYQGYNVRGGAKEVGLATTRAVVAGSVSVLVIDFFVGDALGAVFPFQS
jgi:phospholipid/cholesterol/gamma-HCH transport system permease protein